MDGESLQPQRRPAQRTGHGGGQRTRSAFREPGAHTLGGVEELEAERWRRTDPTITSQFISAFLCIRHLPDLYYRTAWHICCRR